jgi:hypothetical protein
MLKQANVHCPCANERWDEVIGDQALILRGYERLWNDEGPFTAPAGVPVRASLIRERT